MAKTMKKGTCKTTKNGQKYCKGKNGKVKFVKK